MSENVIHLRYRPGTTDDIPALAGLLNSAYRGETSRQGWTTEADLLGGQRTDARELRSLLTQPDSDMLLAVAEEQLLGCVHLQRLAEGVASLGMFAIRPDWQGKGLGKQFLAEAERHCHSRFGARRLQLSVIDLRSELIAFYQRRGFRDTGERAPFPEHDPRFGLPRQRGLRFATLVKDLSPGQSAP